ncbi:MAG TPA: SLBB domain-containing protein [Gemmatimonadaceae bacterium]|nr:SLBB domain-containing protein [Gemmatimonadaceae bacterium]
MRARLRAEGYPEDLLDAYLPGGVATAADSSPSSTVFEAMRALGVTDSTGADLVTSISGYPQEPGAYPSQLGPMGGEGLPGAPGAFRVVCDTVFTDEQKALDTVRPSSVPFDSAWIGDSVSSGDSSRQSRLAPGGRMAEGQPRLVCRPIDRVAVQDPDSGFTIFGQDMFTERTTQFAPNLAGPVDDSYRLGPGDELVLILTGDVEAAYTLDVTREGFVVIPQVGQLHVANLSMGQLRDLLYSRLGRVYSGVRRGANATTKFSVSVARLRTNQVFVVGDVARPGSYRVSSAGTALTALYAAGGPTENGSLRKIEIRRGGLVVDTLDVYDYLLRGDASHDARLESGDIVFVPVHGARVRIVGEVVRPATYEMAEGETLADLILAAGGYSPDASRERVQIERILPPAQRTDGGRDRVVMDIVAQRGAGGGARLTPGGGSVDGSNGDGGSTAANGARFPSTGSGDALDRAAMGVSLAAGDVVRVFPVTNRVRNRISVVGDVWTPGQQGFTPGMRLSDAIERSGGTKPDVYLGQILVTRLLPDSTRIQLRSSFRDSTGAVVNDFELNEDDEIRVFSVAEFRPLRWVSISGAVRKSGRVKYREGMTLRDLVLLAGGLEQSAYLNEAEIARLPENRSAGATAHTIRVSLDSTYLFERGPGGKYLGPPGIPAPESEAPEVELQPYDNVLILRQPNWELQRTVVIGGEVKFPGRYTLLSKKERLSDLIERAGGLTDYAYAGGVSFYRNSKHLGRIGVDLARVMEDDSFRDNLILQDGDSLYIPAYTGVVNVGGAVNSPVAVAYVPGQNLDYYVSAAGGASRAADTKRAYVRQPNGKVESVHRRFLLPDGVPQPGPGSTVFVPEKDMNAKSGFAQSMPVVASVLGSLVAVVALLMR